MTAAPQPKIPARGLRILNVGSSIDPAAGGISESILRLSKAVMKLGHEVETVSVDDPDNTWKDRLQVPIHLKGPPSGPLEYSRDFADWLKQNVPNFDVVIS